MNLFRKSLRYRNEVEKVNRENAESFADSSLCKIAQMTAEAMISEPRELTKLSNDCSILTMKSFCSYAGRRYHLQFRFSDGGKFPSDVSICEVLVDNESITCPTNCWRR